MSNDLNRESAFGSTFGALAVPTYYTVLNIDTSASRMMVREAYLRLKSLYNNGGDGLYGISGVDDLQAQLAELDEAFAVLNDDHRRAEYDRSIGLQSTRPGATSRPVSASGLMNEAAHVGGPESWVSNTSTDTIQTSRSTLKVIKTRATRPDDAKTQEIFQAILNDHDCGDGAILVKLREAINIGIPEIQERTKISLEYIRAMESNRFERLPQVVYVKGFMRSYLKYLCVPNADKIIVAYAARLEAWQAGQKA